MERPVDDLAPTCTDHVAHNHLPQPDHVVERAAALCAALGDASRLRLLELLLDEPHCVSELADETSASMSAVSQRMKILSGARLVRRPREGKHVFYTLADDHVRQILNQVFDHSSE